MTTASDMEVMTISEEADSAVRYVDLPHGNARRSARDARVESNAAAPTALSSHADAPGQEVAERDDEAKLPTVQAKAQQAADDLAERFRVWSASLMAKSLLHARPPTLGETWQRARDCSSHHNSPLMTFLCLAYRCLHIGLVLFPAYALVWCTDSFPKLLVTAAVVFIAIHWI